MKPLRVSPLFPFALTLFTLLACNFPLATPQIENAIMARDFEGNLQTEEFNQQDIFYCTAKLINSPKKSTINATWFAVNTEGIEPNLVIEQTQLITSSGIVHFELTNETLWPKGDYRLDLFLNGNLSQILEFKVK